MLITVHIVDAFIDGDRGGNPAGVVLEADHLTTEQKSMIARAVNLSETAFVSRSSFASLKVEFFTPARQIPHCGHATVATFSLCSQVGHLRDGEHLKESIDGILSLSTSAGKVTMHQTFPTLTPLALDSHIGQIVLKSIGASASSITVERQLSIAKSGNAFLLIPLVSEHHLASLSPDHTLIAHVCEELDLIGFYPFAVATSRPGRTATARMFAPRYGISEESATGTAAGPLGAYLLSNSPKSLSLTCLIEQGHFMNPPSPSLLSVAIVPTTQEGEDRQVHVSGYGHLRKTLEVEA